MKKVKRVSDVGAVGPPSAPSAPYIPDNQYANIPQNPNFNGSLNQNYGYNQQPSNPRKYSNYLMS